MTVLEANESPPVPTGPSVSISKRLPESVIDRSRVVGDEYDRYIRTADGTIYSGDGTRIPDLGKARGEIGSLDYFGGFSTVAAGGEPVPNCNVMVEATTRPLKVTLSATLHAALAATLGAIYLYEDATIMGFLHFTSPGADSYIAMSKAFRKNPAPGWHSYGIYLASYTGGAINIFSVDPISPGAELIVEEI